MHSLIMQSRLRVGERAFSSAAPRLWYIPTDIKRAATLLTFKKKLKISADFSYCI